MNTRPDYAISYADAATRLGCTKTTIHLMLKDGRLKRAVRPGLKKGCGVLAASVDELMKGGAK